MPTWGEGGIAAEDFSSEVLEDTFLYLYWKHSKNKSIPLPLHYRRLNTLFWYIHLRKKLKSTKKCWEKHFCIFTEKIQKTNQYHFPYIILDWIPFFVYSLHEITKQNSVGRHFFCIFTENIPKTNQYPFPYIIVIWILNSGIFIQGNN